MLPAMVCRWPGHLGRGQSPPEHRNDLLEWAPSPASQAGHAEGAAVKQAALLLSLLSLGPMPAHSPL